MTKLFPCRNHLSVLAPVYFTAVCFELRQRQTLVVCDRSSLTLLFRSVTSQLQLPFSLCLPSHVTCHTSIPLPFPCLPASLPSSPCSRAVLLASARFLFSNTASFRMPFAPLFFQRALLILQLVILTITIDQHTRVLLLLIVADALIIITTITNYFANNDNEEEHYN